MKAFLQFSVIMTGLLLFCSGCATGTTELDVRVPVPLDPQSSNAVTIRSVDDNRHFTNRAANKMVHSVNSFEDLDKSFTSRVIVRKANSYGTLMGVIALPEGRTVAGVVEETITKSFREKGYSVISSNAAVDASVPAVQAEISRFWCYIMSDSSSGLSANEGFRIKFEAEITLHSDLLIENPTTVRVSKTKAGYLTGKASNHGETIDAGLKKLSDEIQRKLK